MPNYNAPRTYIAYAVNVFDTIEVGRPATKAEAWKLARAATKQARADRPGISHTAAIYDSRANDGRGSMIYAFPKES